MFERQTDGEIDVDSKTVRIYMRSQSHGKMNFLRQGLQKLPVDHYRHTDRQTDRYRQADTQMRPNVLPQLHVRVVKVYSDVSLTHPIIFTGKNVRELASIFAPTRCGFKTKQHIESLQRSLAVR